MLWDTGSLLVGPYIKIHCIYMPRYFVVVESQCETTSTSPSDMNGWSQFYSRFYSRFGPGFGPGFGPDSRSTAILLLSTRSAKKPCFHRVIRSFNPTQSQAIITPCLGLRIQGLQVRFLSGAPYLNFLQFAFPLSLKFFVSFSALTSIQTFILHFLVSSL